MQCRKTQQAVANFEDERGPQVKEHEWLPKAGTQTHCPHNLQKGAKPCRYLDFSAVRPLSELCPLEL